MVFEEMEKSNTSDCRSYNERFTSEQTNSYGLFKQIDKIRFIKKGKTLENKLLYKRTTL